MTQSLAIAKNILTMAAVQHRFGGVPSSDPQFFSEWVSDLPELAAAEIDTLDQIKARFDRHRNHPPNSQANSSDHRQWIAQGQLKFLPQEPLKAPNLT